MQKNLVFYKRAVPVQKLNGFHDIKLFSWKLSMHNERVLHISTILGSSVASPFYVLKIQHIKKSGSEVYYLNDDLIRILAG